MRRNSLLLSTACLWTLAAAVSPAVAADAKAGKAIYEKRCLSCHGADGRGNPAMIKAMGEKGLNLTAKEVAGAKDDELMKVIVEGRGKMPATKGLTKDEAKQVLEYTRSLAK
ncbi:MAG TPA: cytochrome c [Candidatus Acidoferrales bacterium]|nr:cytochrome c [Candidatus Acidoferrales bacterium]